MVVAIAATLLVALMLHSTTSVADAQPARRTVLTRVDVPLPAGVELPSGTPPELEKLGWRNASLTEAEIERLSALRPRDISDEQRVAIAMAPDDPYFASQWSHAATGTDQAWASTTGSQSQVIALLDTGVDHVSELSGRVLDGYNVLDGTTDTTDDNGHGTAAAGVAAAAGNNAAFGTGVCWSCKILPVKVLDDSGIGNTDDVATGVVWATDHGATVISLSLGGPEGSEVLRSAIDYAVAKNVVVTAAAGNDGNSTTFYPAGYSEVISVGAVTAGGTPYPWSNVGPWIDMQAPGCNLTQERGGDIKNFCGTSSATPYVAGVIALRQSVSGSTIESPEYLEQIMRDTAAPPNPALSASVGLIRTQAMLSRPISPADPNTDDPYDVLAAGFHPIDPTRVLDTRTGLGTSTTAKVGPRQTMWLQLGGRGGIPMSGVSAVSLNLTATEASTATYLAVHPYGEARPNTSVLNPTPGLDTSNAVITTVGPLGMIGIYNNSGSTHMVVDVNGWFDTTTGGAGGAVLYNALTPSRILDTRTGPGPMGQAGGTWRLRAGQVMNVQIAGRGGIPASATSAVLTVTVTDASSAGHLSVWRSGLSKPTVSSTNFATGDTVAASVTTPLSADGRVALFSPNADIDVVVDTAGYYGTAGSGYTPIPSERLMDSRSWLDSPGRLVPGSPLFIAFGPSTVVPSGTTAVVAKFTITEPVGPGYATSWPAGQPAPVSSVLNWRAGQTATNLVYQSLSPNGGANLRVSNGNPYVLVDLFGYFTPVA